jgi:hypothetical protein
MRFINHTPFCHFLYIFLFVLLVSQLSFAQTCTHTFTPTSIPATYIVENGMVVCVSGTGNLSGAVVVRAGGVLKICQATLTGSITIDPAWGPLPGGKLIKSS